MEPSTLPPALPAPPRRRQNGAGDVFFLRSELPPDLQAEAAPVEAAETRGAGGAATLAARRGKKTGAKQMIFGSWER